ncbi:MAG: hypothetical protein ABI488_11500 [Polyangiaceae bacterium]
MAFSRVLVLSVCALLVTGCGSSSDQGAGGAANGGNPSEGGRTGASGGAAGADTSNGGSPETAGGGAGVADGSDGGAAGSAAGATSGSATVTPDCALPDDLPSCINELTCTSAMSGSLSKADVAGVVKGSCIQGTLSSSTCPLDGYGGYCIDTNGGTDTSVIAFYSATLPSLPSFKSICQNTKTNKWCDITNK